MLEFWYSNTGDIMSNFVRISVHLISLLVCGYVLLGFDFAKVLRKGHEHKGQLLYVLASIAFAYLVAQFLLSISISFVY